MTTPLEITFHNMDPSAAVETRVREKVARLEKKFQRLTHARVVIEAPHRHQQRGKIFQIKIDLGVPGRSAVMVNRSSDDHAHEDVYVALRDAFAAAERQLADETDRMSGNIKSHGNGKRT